jgi:hypothetical protein
MNNTKISHVVSPDGKGGKTEQKKEDMRNTRRKNRSSVSESVTEDQSKENMPYIANWWWRTPNRSLKKGKASMNKLFSLHLTHLPTWRYQGVLVATLLAVVLGFGALSFAPAAHAASLAQTSSANRSAVVVPAVIDRCQSGYACFYPGTGWNGGHPTMEWLKYGVYRIYGWTGNHLVFNNQTGGALFRLCTDLQGNNCPITLYPPQNRVVNLTPIFSVRLLM